MNYWNKVIFLNTKNFPFNRIYILLWFLSAIIFWKFLRNTTSFSSLFVSFSPISVLFPPIFELLPPIFVLLPPLFVFCLHYSCCFHYYSCFSCDSNYFLRKQHDVLFKEYAWLSNLLFFSGGRGDFYYLLYIKIQIKCLSTK